MTEKMVPGTAIPYADSNGMFAMFRPLIRATDGLTLGQVCAITGLEVSTIQNWVKRKFVPRPVEKKYHERQLARILLISALRDGMKIDAIGELMTMVNGDADDVSDDIISEALLHIDRRASQYTIIAEPSEETILIDVDGRLIVQVLINLINNAIQYTPPGSTIRISSVNMGDCAKVIVADDGPGIPDSEKDSVFTMFYSGSKKVTDSKRSLGLGLALCRSIIRAHGCEIMLDDNIPHGCIFSFTLPMKEVTLHE